VASAGADVSTTQHGNSNALGGGAVSEHHHPHVITTAASSSNASSADLLNYYASEPASAPARSQHQSAFSFMGGNDGGTVAPPPSAAPVASSLSSSPFGFITEESDSSTSAPVDPLAGVGEDSGDSHAPAAASAGGADSAFSFLGGSNCADIPPVIDGWDFGNLLLPWPQQLSPWAALLACRWAQAWASAPVVLCPWAEAWADRPTACCCRCR